MSTQPTPYDGSAAPFTIGLKPLDLAEWLQRDDTFDLQLAEKRRRYAEMPGKVFVEEPDTSAAQSEVLALIEDHLGTAAPASDAAPLIRASLLVQEDLILMRRGEDGWRLAAGSLCFPSSWTLTEKFGLPLHEIHAPVPGFGAGTRNHELIHRMFDRLHQPVMRWNWSVQAGGALYHPLSNAGRDERATARAARFGIDDVKAAAFIRVERQTLRKLPESGDILFTIRIYLDPLGWIARHGERAQIAPAFAQQLMQLDAAQLDYKGLTADRDLLVAALGEIAQS
ncbi:MAG: DUF3445 domain-containing protein [Mesorhizobium sp.]